MKSRATRNRRLRSCAWAFLAALLPAAEVWADGDSMISASPANLAAEGTTTAVAPRPKKTSGSRPKIPLPRKFVADPAPVVETPAPATPSALPAATASAPADAPATIPATPEPLSQGDPSRIAAAAALLNSAPPAESAPALSVNPEHAAAAAVAPVTPEPLSQGDPSRIAAAAALLNATAPAESPPVATETPALAVSPEQSPGLSQAELTPPATSDSFSVNAASAAPAGEPSSLASGAVAPVENFAAPAEPIPAPAEAPAPSGEMAAPTAEAVPAQQAQAESNAAAAAVVQAAAPPAAAAVKTDASVEKTGCSTCGGFHSTLDGPAFHGSFGCSTGQCVPGRKGCSVPANDCDTIVGNFIQNLWQCLCCPDPCYKPEWVPAANASFFADYARPRTITRLRFDRLMDMTHPDRNQFFMKNPVASPITLPNSNRPNSRFQGKFLANPSLNMSQFTLYQEAATERASVFFEMPYRQINPLVSQTEAGFADLNFGTKALLFDCEMLQVSFQFRTFMPSGNSQIGLGTAHVSLDPSLLASLKLTPDTYLQAQLGNWIPLGGTQNIAGGMAYWFFSLNQVLAYITPDSPLIGTFEFDGWSFENGGYTPSFIPTGSKAKNYVSSGGGVSYFNLGPGLRMSVCNKVDFGGAITWATTMNHWADPWFRLEMRFLF